AQARPSSREPFAAIAYLDYHDVTKVNSCPCPRPRCCAVGLKPSLDPFSVAGANRPPPQAPVPLQTTYRNSFVKRVPELDIRSPRCRADRPPASARAVSSLVCRQMSPVIAIEE